MGMQEEALLYADFIRIVLEIVATATTQGVQLNPHLIYTLLHKRELLAPFRAHAHFSEAAKAIDEVCTRANYRPASFSDLIFFYETLFLLVMFRSLEAGRQL
jgi:hypothetical protein